MLDFMTISTKKVKKDGDTTIEIFPRFKTYPKSTDLMIRGGDFYAIWIEERGLWSTNEQDALQLIDLELYEYSKEYQEKHPHSDVSVLSMQDSRSGMIDSWHKYCQKQLRDSFEVLDEKLIFTNSPTNKEDYASKRLPYPLEPCDTPNYEKLISTLYTEDERKKIEWSIGSIVSGDSKTIQKFLVFYGAAGTGKSTIINIIQQLFEGYYAVFDAKALGSSNNAFALESFRSNPLVAIQHDGDLSRIEDNTRLNSLVSHELMTVNEKFKATYPSRFKCFLYMGTNKPVKITDAKSGLIRRLIDVTPSGNKLDVRSYNKASKNIKFELGGIASHCLEVYQNDPGAYDDYVPLSMLGASNDFYNFVLESYHVFIKEDGVSLGSAWEMYKTYCDEANVAYPYSKRNFKEELKNYFVDFKDRVVSEDGTRLRSYYSRFRTEKFGLEDGKKEQKNNDILETGLLEMNAETSLFDKVCGECPAQYATEDETPTKKWDNVYTKLSEIDTRKLHYVRVPENHIVIDFDIKDKTGNKSLKLNLESASKWPKTYAELSKGGSGVHLHYLYSGDVSKLSRVYDDNIEIKVFSGNSSLRRRLTKCNDLEIATISSGLPLKGDDKLINFDGVTNEKAIRTIIKKNLNKEYHSFTKPSIDFIFKTLEDAYNSGVVYDVTNMKNSILAFAASSSNNAQYCINKVAKMHFQSETVIENVEEEGRPLVFFDIEIFPNLALVNWKLAGEGKPVIRMINPKSSEIEQLMQSRLVGFNCREYDNHILYGMWLGYSNEELYNLSTKIIGGAKNAKFREAYNISYTDVYDFAAKKQSLKKWEIELGIHHQELGLPWDKPVDPSLWSKVAEYCDNDVIATEAVFNKLKGDFAARKILASLANGTVNDKTNTLSTRIIFGSNKKPQSQFNYRNLGDSTQIDKDANFLITRDLQYKNLDEFDEYTAFDKDGRPIFPGYKYEFGVSTYRGENVGEGGCVRSNPGMYTDVALLDIASMHPSTIIAEQLFGEMYTKRFQDIRDARIAVKHEDWDSARKMLDGSLAPYADELANGTAWYTNDDLSQALKIVINSIYGLTSAKFDNPFRDIRNKDNIVAKRGALFMINLKFEVEKRGFVVAHVKTDSIKIPNATPEIIKFVQDYGAMYGYSFEHEATYDRMCLVNDAVYIAKYATVDRCYELYGKDYIDSSKDICKKNKKHPGEWTATGTQFQIPYVFKRLFSKDQIVFEDMCETKSVTSALYLDMNENLEQGDHEYVFIGRVGQFCPIKPGCGGGLLVREAKDKEGNLKYDSATGARDFRWMESETVRILGKESDIDRTYYERLVNNAITSISEYGDYEWFVDDYKPTEQDLIAPWETAENPEDYAFSVR